MKAFFITMPAPRARHGGTLSASGQHCPALHHSKNQLWERSMSLSLRTCVPISLALLCTGVLAEPQALTVISFGGATKQAQDKAYFQPFNASGAGRIVAGEYNGELSKIKAMVSAGHTSWDVVEVGSPELLRGCEEGLFEKLDAGRFGDS